MALHLCGREVFAWWSWRICQNNLCKCFSHKTATIMLAVPSTSSNTPIHGVSRVLYTTHLFFSPLDAIQRHQLLKLLTVLNCKALLFGKQEFLASSVKATNSPSCKTITGHFLSLALYDSMPLQWLHGDTAFSLCFVMGLFKRVSTLKTVRNVNNCFIQTVLRAGI